MGTAVLLPQDCLRPRSRLKNQSPFVGYPVESAPRSNRNLSAPLQGLGSGLLPLPNHARHSSDMSATRRGSNVKHMKARKASGWMDTNTRPLATPDLSVCRILQRPKQDDSAVELLAHFAISDKSGPLQKVDRPQVVEDLEQCVVRTVAQAGALGAEMEAFKMKQKCSCNHAGELSDAGSVIHPGSTARKGKDSRECADLPSANRRMLSGVKVVQAKLKKEKLSAGFSTKTAGRNDITVKGRIGEEPDKASPQGLTQLRRTSTEPPMAIPVVGQYTRNVLHIALSNPRLGAHAPRHTSCEGGVDLSCEERWAGPAYSSSPPPSSLPLPTLCLPHPKLATVKVPPLVKQYSASVYTQTFIETSAPPFGVSRKEGAWDAAFATKSLRRLLNLDS